MQSSVSASKITNTDLALQGSNKETETVTPIKSQQTEIKALLSSPAELQKKLGVKTLPPEKQKVLQQDLSKQWWCPDRVDRSADVAPQGCQ